MRALYELFYLSPVLKRHQSMVVEADDMKGAKQQVRDHEACQDLKFLEVWKRVQQEGE